METEIQKRALALITDGAYQDIILGLMLRGWSDDKIRNLFYEIAETIILAEKYRNGAKSVLYRF